MDKDIREYVGTCLTCQCYKCLRYARYGLPYLLELPYVPWDSIAMDFIVELPLSNGCSQIWVIIDRFTKMAHFIPLKDTKKKAKDLGLIFARNIWQLHGLPTKIISDWDRRFTSDLWSSLCELLGIRQKMSTSFQPKTDGQTERVNQTIEAFIRSYCSYE
jgi:transposase InsO family protein